MKAAGKKHRRQPDIGSGHAVIVFTLSLLNIFNRLRLLGRFGCLLVIPVLLTCPSTIREISGIGYHNPCVLLI